MKRIAKTTTPKMLPFNQTWERIWKLTKDIPEPLDAIDSLEFSLATKRITPN
jgi:hypothetical protein